MQRALFHFTHAGRSVDSSEYHRPAKTSNDSGGHDAEVVESAFIGSEAGQAQLGVGKLAHVRDATEVEEQQAQAQNGRSDVGNNSLDHIGEDETPHTHLDGPELAYDQYCNSDQDGVSVREFAQRCPLNYRAHCNEPENKPGHEGDDTDGASDQFQAAAVVPQVQ